MTGDFVQPDTNVRHDPISAGPSHAGTEYDLWNNPTTRKAAQTTKTAQKCALALGLMRTCFVVLDQQLDMMTALAFLEAWDAEVPAPRWGREAIERAYMNAIRRRQGGTTGG